MKMYAYPPESIDIRWHTLISIEIYGYLVKPMNIY